MNPVYYSQLGQDKWVYENIVLNPQYHVSPKGFFVEIGAYKTEGSNTLFFERSLGWKGLVVEANPLCFPELLKARNASQTRVVCAAAGEDYKTVKFRAISGMNEQLSGIVDTLSTNYKGLLDYYREAPDVNQRPVQDRELIVATVPLKDIFKQEDVNVIDYMTIDTEGSEVQVLKGIDFDKVEIKVLQVEMNTFDKQVHDMILSKGFSLLHKMNQDYIYVSQ